MECVLMSEPAGASRGAAAWVTMVLIAAAGVALGYRGAWAVGGADADPLESTLALAVARQLTDGPSGLYGPFGGHNPQALIHAPLYYRLAGLVAWPLARMGLDPVSASFAAGRGLSALGLLATMAIAWRLARLGGGPRRVGLWAALLVAAMPVLGGFPAAVRPDMTAVALGSLGVLLVLSSLRGAGPGRRRWTIVGAYAAFGLAICVKQQAVTAPAISTGLLLAAWRRGGVPYRSIERGVLTALGIVLVVFVAEELVTAGRMSRAVVHAASYVPRVHPSSWVRVVIVGSAVVIPSGGLLAVIAGSSLARLGGRRPALATAGTAVLALVVATTGLELLGARLGAGNVEGAVLPLLAIVGLLAARRSSPSEEPGSIDAALWVYVAGELALMAALCGLSTGAWTNYAIQAGVFVCVLAARSLGKALAGESSPRVLAPAAIGVLAVLIHVVLDVREVAERQRVEQAAMARVFDRAGWSPNTYFFVDLPGENRLWGVTGLVYDPWLYPVFEAAREAEPRAGWLLPALSEGPIRIVVALSPSPRIDGLGPTLPELGYRAVTQSGPYYVWERTRP